MTISRQRTFLYKSSTYSFVIWNDIDEEAEINQKDNKQRPET